MYAVGSLFSGIGGIELGFENTGAFKTLWFVEKDRYAQAVIRKQWGNDAVIYDDITRLDFRKVQRINVLTGGFPCQDISTAGKGTGITGSRSSLWRYYKKAIRILRPQVAFIENVSILTGRGLNVVLGDLASIGYDAEWYCVSASAVGAPHQRDRVFIISYLQSKRKRNLSKEQSGDYKSDVSRGSKEIPYTGESGLERTKSKGSQFIEHCGWISEPNVDRMADGVSLRVDRVRCLGNSVVPQVSEVFAEAIKDYLFKKEIDRLNKKWEDNHMDERMARIEEQMEHSTYNSFGWLHTQVR